MAERWKNRARGALVARACREARRARGREHGPARESARRPARAAALGVRAAGLRRRSGPAPAVDLPHPGPYRADRHVAQPLGLPPERAGARRSPLRRGGLPAVSRRVRRRLDLLWWLAVPRLAGCRELPHL